MVKPGYTYIDITTAQRVTYDAPVEDAEKKGLKLLTVIRAGLNPDKVVKKQV